MLYMKDHSFGLFVFLTLINEKDYKKYCSDSVFC